MISLELTPVHDLDRVKTAVAEVITAVAPVLPRGAEEPVLTVVSREVWPSIWLALVAEERTPARLFPAAQRIHDRLARIPDVSEVRSPCVFPLCHVRLKAA